MNRPHEQGTANCGENRDWPKKAPSLSLVAACLVLFAGFASVSAQPALDSYLEQRKQHRISAPVGLETALTTVGTRSFEVSANVRGSLARNGEASLLLELADGDHVVVRVGSSQGWLLTQTGALRLILKTTRLTESAEPSTEVLIAIQESAMLQVEVDEARKRVLDAKARDAKSIASRASVRKPDRPEVAVERDWSLSAHEATPYYAGYVKRQNSRLTDREAYGIAEAIVGFSLRFGVDARLILAMVQVESGFDPGATSRSGAQGLGQLMPNTARGLGVTNSYDTHENLFGTVKLIRNHIANYMKQTGDEYESLVLALAAYNAGSGAVRRHGGVPPYRETQNYIPKVISLYRRLCEGS